jgi:hypothetical protein
MRECKLLTTLHFNDKNTIIIPDRILPLRPGDVFVGDDDANTNFIVEQVTFSCDDFGDDRYSAERFTADVWLVNKD